MNIAILFDMDGTILNTEPLYAKAEIRLFSEYGVVIPKEDLSLFRGCSEEAFYSLSMKKYNIKENKNIFIEKGRRYVLKEFQNKIPFMPGFIPLINRISNKYNTGLVTASPSRTLNFINNKLNLHLYFNQMISGEETKKNKPFPDPYIEMMKRLNSNPENCIIIEDSKQGLRAAIESKAKTIAITGSVPKKELINADIIINHLDEITIKLIEKLFLAPK